MIVRFYSFLPVLLFLPVDSSSIRNRNFNNDLLPSLRSSLDRKGDNSLKVVSNEPFIIQLQMPNPGASEGRRKEKDMKSKRPAKKRVSKIKPSRKRPRKRRDLQLSKKESEKHSKREFPELKNETNAISRSDILKALSSYLEKREMNKKSSAVEEKRNNDSDVRLLPQERAPLVRMVYPSTPKTDKRPHKYTYKDLIADRERLDKKIKYIRNMLNVSNADDLVRVRRRSESDRTANKIAKMFLTLSAVNGLHDRLKPRCDDDEDEDRYHVQDVWEKERKDSTRKSSSSNEERYKVKKWIEHMKSKRYSRKTCPCLASDYEDDSDAFPLEQKLPKSGYMSQQEGSSEESLETYRDSPSAPRERANRNGYYRKRNHRARDDQDKFKALAGRGNRKLELPLDDLELYRSKAKQILQNAEEILDRIKEEEEKRLSTPSVVMSQLKELTSRIQSDPRNNENDLIRKLQRNLGWGPTAKSPEEPDGNNFLENVKSFILDPYEKAKALTDESTKKLSSYLLRNLGELQDSGEKKENDENDFKKYFEQVPRREEEKPLPASLAREDIENQPEGQSDTVSSVHDTEESAHEEQFKKRMEEIIKEQEKKLNEYEVTEESEENTQESRNDEEKLANIKNPGTEVSSRKDEPSVQLHQRGETISDPENQETHTESDGFSESSQTNRQEEVAKNLEKEQIDKEVGKEVKEDEKEPEDFSVVQSIHEEPNDSKEMQEVGAPAQREQETSSRELTELEPNTDARFSSGSQDENSPPQAEDLQETESKETVSQRLKDPENEKSNQENLEALNFSKENVEIVNVSEEETKEQQKETDEGVQESVESVQEVNVESLKNTNEERGNEDVRETLEVSSEDRKEEEPSDQTSLEDQVRQTETEVGETKSDRHSDERESEKDPEESSSESSDGLKAPEEVQRSPGAAEGDEVAQSYQQPEDASNENSHTKSTEESEENPLQLKAAKDSQSFEDSDVDVGDQGEEAVTAPRGEENEEDDKETLESAVSQKEPREDDDSVRSMENLKNENDLDNTDDKLREKAPSEEVESEQEATSKERSDDNSDEEEQRVEAAYPNNLKYLDEVFDIDDYEPNKQNETPKEDSEENDDLEGSNRKIEEESSQSPDDTVSVIAENQVQEKPNESTETAKSNEEPETVKAVANDQEEDETSKVEAKELDDNTALSDGGDEDVKESQTSREEMNEEPSVGPAKDDEETNETLLEATNPEDKHREAENEISEEADESISMKESADDAKMSQEPGETEGGDREVKENENPTEDNDTSLRATLDNDEELAGSGETLKATDAVESENENLRVEENETSSEETDKDTSLRATVTKNDDEVAENDDDSDGVAKSVEENENTVEDNDDVPLRATEKKIDESESRSDEISLKQNQKDDEPSLENDSGATGNEDGVDSSEDTGNTPLRAENTQHFENESPEEKARSFEEFSNNIDDNEVDEATPLRSAMDRNDPKSFENNSEESVRASNIPEEIQDENEGIPIGSLEDQKSKDSKEITSKALDSIETTEDKSTLAAADPTHEANSDSLQKLPPRKKSLKVPSSIAQIVKDLDGKEKYDITSMEKLNPEKIDHIIDKIDEAEQQNKVNDEVDCRKECACAEDIDIRSRNMGRYEIVKDILHWMKDLQLNRVLTDD